ncbi:PAS domain-containing protein [Loktanella sp. M215]|uniref:PAS domain-containing protein n=1 Tax=Loktanella sp. M215 TaxID=2675431 RepID=UPI001F0019A5|nr:PAS domain-containing protein [Loktanella sp. M215]MCF7701728.1 PAS domain-containing protein [Loktanella sp. M215]
MSDLTRFSGSRDFTGLPAISTYAWDSATDCLTLSAGAQHMLGVASPISTDDFFDRVHVDDRVKFAAETISFLETGGEQTREFRFCHSDGTLRYVISHASLERLHRTDQDRITGVFIDVTHAREHDTRVIGHRSENFGFYDHDVATGSSTWSPGLQRMLITPLATPMTEKAIHDSIHPDDREWFAARTRAIKSVAGSYEFTFRVVLPDDRILLVRDRGEAHAPVDPTTGKVSRLTGTLTDITPTTHIGSLHKLANNAFWQLIDTAPVGAYAVDSDLRMVRVSRGAHATFAGIDNLLGRDLDDVLHILWPEPFASEAVAQFRNTLISGDPYHADPVVEDRADRNVLEAYDWSIERIILEDGRPGVLCYFYDLSERVRHERTLEEQQLRLSLAYDAANMGAWEIDLVNGGALGTPKLFEMFGEPDFTGDVSDLWRRRIHADDQSLVDATFEEAVRNGGPFNVDFRIVTGNGDVRHMAAKAILQKDKRGRPSRMIGVDHDITHRKETELALRDSQHQLRTVLDHTVAFIGVLGPAGTLREANRPAIEFGGLSRDDVIGKPFWEAFWWTHDDAVADRCRQAVIEGQAGRAQRFDVVVRGEEDRLITIDFLLAPVFDDAGVLQMMVVSGFDISDREKARERERSLMGEINHRTKNILTLVQVVARQTARGGAAGFVARFEERIAALAKAQDLLFSSKADRVDLKALAKSQLGHLSDVIESRIILNGPPVALDADAAQAVGMALHELATNAGKYGALSSGDGRVDVAWQMNSHDDTFEIRWSERDGPPVIPPETKGFGSTVIDQMTRSVLDAEVQLDYEPEGVRWRLVCARDALSKSSQNYS